MKVETVPASFTPVTIQITFESAEELQMFANMVGYNESIPELVTKHTARENKVREYKLYSDMLTALHRKSTAELFK